MIRYHLKITVRLVFKTLLRGKANVLSLLSFVLSVIFLSTPLSLIWSQPFDLSVFAKKSETLARTGQRDSSEALIRLALRQTEDAAPSIKAGIILVMTKHLSYFMETDSAINYALQALTIAEEENLEQERVEALYFNGYLQQRKIHLAPAMEYCESAISMARQLKDTLLEAKCLTCISSALRTYYNSVEYKQPLIDYEHALTVFETQKDTSSIISTLLTLTDMYRIEVEKHGQKAESYFRRAELLLGKHQDVVLHVKWFNMKSGLLAGKGQANQSLEAMSKALNLSKRIGLPWMIQHLYLEMSEHYHAKKEYLKAITYVDSAEIAFPNFLFADSEMRYAALYAALGQHKTAYEKMIKAVHLGDSLIHARQEEMTAESEVRLKTKEKEIELLEKQAELQIEQSQNKLLWGGALIMLVIAGAIFLAYTIQRRAKNTLSHKNQLIEKQAKELRQLDGLKSRFFANVSHELRTPLTLMLGPVKSLLKANPKDSDERMLLQFIQRNAWQLQKLINEILDLSKLENDKLEIVEQPVLFYPYLKSQMAQFHSFAESIELQFKLNYFADETLHLLLDKGKFEKIVHNFLSNAFKFTPPKGEVILSIEPVHDKQLLLKVSDNGRGIHPNDLPFVFDRYYQSKQLDAKTEGGTGIGLSLSRELAELLNGKIWAESELNKGSVFYFQFPQKKVVAPHLSRHNDRQEENVSPVLIPNIGQKITSSPANAQSIDKEVIKPATILIVEDNSDLLQYLQFLLSDYNIVTAKNGEEALQKLTNNNQQLNVDLIISDLMMPIMDGFQLLEQLKSQDRWRHLPTLMLTAKVNARAKLKALRIGVDDYLTKPFQEEELKARVENLLHNYRERMEYFSVNRNEEDETVKVLTKPVIAKVDAEWLEEVEKAFYKILNDSSLKLDWIATKLHLSQRQLYRRLQQLTGLTPRQYLHEMRMSRAYDLLIEGRYATVKEVSYAVGIRDTKYFSKRFQERFGTPPSSLR